MRSPKGWSRSCTSKTRRPDSESEPLLRHYVEQAREAAIDYSRMSVAVAQLARQRSSEFSTLFRQLGAIQRIAFTGVAPDGEDLFSVQFAGGSMSWGILPAENGNIDMVGFTFRTN